MSDEIVFNNPVITEFKFKCAPIFILDAYGRPVNINTEKNITNQVEIIEERAGMRLLSATIGEMEAEK